MITEKPDKPGFYWFKGKLESLHDGWDDVEPTVVSVQTDTDGLRVYFPEGRSAGVSISRLEGQWIGPLEMPKELNE